MNAAEIIEMIKKLPPEERAAVEAFLKSEKEEMRVEETVQREARYIPKEEAERIAEGIFQRHSELFRKLAQ